MTKNIPTKVNMKTNATQTKKPRKRQNKLSANQRISKKVSDTPYALARLDPFHPGACGARVPDEYSGHTATLTLKTSLTINGAAAMDCIIFPNLKAPMISTTQSLVGAATLTWADNTTTANVFGWHSGVLAGKIANYRIVGYGVRITSVSSMTSASGRIVIATLPLESHLVTKQFTVGGVSPATNASLTAGQTLTGWGIPTTGTSVSAAYLAEIPDSVIISMLDLAENDYDIVPNLCSTDAYNFRNSDDRYTGFDMAYQTATGHSSDASYLKFGGFETVVIAVDGATTTSPVEIEVIYHVEGCPSTTGGISGGVSSIIAPAVARSPVDPPLLDRVNIIAAVAPIVRKAVIGSASTIHPLLGKFADAVL